MLFDSHAHINNEDNTPQLKAELVEAIERSSLDYVMDIGFDLSSSERAAANASEFSWCYATVGCHPHDAKTMDEDKLQRLRELAKEKKVLAIGEIGLDFHYDLSDRDVQRQWFRKQIRLANELRMPIVIHAREADREVMDILKEEEAFSENRKSWFRDRENDARVLLHCFSGSAELGKEYIRLGATLSVAGPVTYKNNRKTVKMVEQIPIEHLLVETDSPFLTPAPFRGKRNMPTMVEYTARKIADIKGMTFEEIAEITRKNAIAFYGIKEG